MPIMAESSFRLSAIAVIYNFCNPRTKRDTRTFWIQIARRTISRANGIDIEESPVA